MAVGSLGLFKGRCGLWLRRIRGLLRTAPFPGSQPYWESGYAAGGTSGTGSYGKLAEFKAEVLNSFVREHEIRSVIEFGCGDGNQLSLATYCSYVGFDVSPTAIQRCQDRFRHDETKQFFLYNPDIFEDVPQSKFRAELALSLDVVYHLTEDKIFELSMSHLFSVSEKFVIIYSTDTDVNHRWQEPHVKHRHFSEWVKENLSEWELLQRIPNTCSPAGNDLLGSSADFFIYQR